LEFSHRHLAALIYPPDFHRVIISTCIIVSVAVAAFNVADSCKSDFEVSLTGARGNQWQRRMTTVKSTTTTHIIHRNMVVIGSCFPKLGKYCPRPKTKGNIFPRQYC